MTTILKAVRELEGDRMQAPARLARPPDRYRGLLVTSIALMLLGLGVGGASLMFFRSGDTTPRSVSLGPLGGNSQPQVAPPQPAAVLQPQAFPAKEDVPWARVGKSQPAFPPAAARPAPRVPRPPSPGAKLRQKLPLRERAESGASAPEMAGLQVKSINYAANPTERSVVLQITDGRPMKLHEGESAGGVEVQLILPKAVYLRQGGNIFAVGGAP